MLAEVKWKALRELVEGSSKEELIWINGYLSGLLGQSSPSPSTAESTATPTAPAVSKITLTYGTETGNAKKLATQFAGIAKKKGIQVRLAGLDQYRLTDLSKDPYFFSVISTHGDGEPPASALKFFDHLRSADARYEQMKYGILALGDSAYPLFCEAGREADQLLESRGASRLLPLVECDTDYQAIAEQWFASVLESLSSSAPTATTAPAAVKPSGGKKNYTGTVLTNINLNAHPSAKKTHHLEIECDEEIHYQPGDAAGFIPHNNQAVVDQVLLAIGCDGSEQVSFKNQHAEIRELLTKKINLVYLPERVVKKYAELVQADIEPQRVNLAELLKKHPLPKNISTQQLVDILEPIAPRLYSIASSPDSHSGELHLTVAQSWFDVDGERQAGLCSTYLNNLAEDSSVEFYIHENHRFRLPAEDKDIIMVGPGTGIAPFRSFLAERDSSGASGKNWLFFGDQHFTTDFLYQTELQDFLNTGVLTRIDLAFSRDQAEKIYVQHRLKEKGAEVYQWLQNGAYFYVCGTKDPMSVDVENTLLEIISEHGNISIDDAKVYLEQLITDNRYLKDVY